MITIVSAHLSNGYVVPMSQRCSHEAATKIIDDATSNGRTWNNFSSRALSLAKLLGFTVGSNTKVVSIERWCFGDDGDVDSRIVFHVAEGKEACTDTYRTSSVSNPKKKRAGTHQ